MKFHLTLDGKNAVCGAVANRPDTFLYDKAGFASHYASEYRCKKCAKIFDEMEEGGKDNSAHGIAEKHRRKIEEQNKNMPDAMRGVMQKGGKAGVKMSHGKEVLKNLYDRQLIKDSDEVNDAFVESEDAITSGSEEACYYAIRNLYENDFIKDPSGDHIEEVKEYLEANKDKYKYEKGGEAGGKYSIDDFVELKDDSFTYIGKNFKQERYVSKDLRYYISSDDGFDYTRIYIAKPDGKAEAVDAFHHKHNPNSYPIYSIESAIDKINEVGMNPEYKLKINPSQFRKGVIPSSIEMAKGGKVSVNDFFSSYANDGGLIFGGYFGGSTMMAKGGQLGKYDEKWGCVYLTTSEREVLTKMFYSYAQGDKPAQEVYEQMKPYFLNTQMYKWFSFEGYDVWSATFIYTPSIRANKYERYSDDYFVIFKGDTPVHIVNSSTTDSVFYDMNAKFGTDRNASPVYHGYKKEMMMAKGGEVDRGNVKIFVRFPFDSAVNLNDSGAEVAEVISKGINRKWSGGKPFEVSVDKVWNKIYATFSVKVPKEKQKVFDKSIDFIDSVKKAVGKKYGIEYMYDKYGYVGFVNWWRNEKNEKVYKVMLEEAKKDKEWAQNKEREAGREWKEASDVSRKALADDLDVPVEEIARENYNYLAMRAHALGEYYGSAGFIDMPAKEKWEKLSGEEIKLEKLKDTVK